MAKATIVFADGSKQMAHNLDDSRLRWHLRRVDHPDDAYTLQAEGIAVRYGEPESVAQAQQYIHELKAQRAAILAAKRLVLDERTDAGRAASNGLYQAEKLIEQERQRLNAWVQEYAHRAQRSQRPKEYTPLSVAKHEAKLERIKAQTGVEEVRQKLYIYYLTRHMDYLYQVLNAHGIDAPPLVTGHALHEHLDPLQDDLLLRLHRGEIENDFISREIKGVALRAWGIIYDDREK